MGQMFHLREVKGGYEYGGNIAGVFGETPELAKSNFFQVLYPGFFEWVNKYDFQQFKDQDKE